MIELIVAAAMMVVITGATVSVLVSALRTQPEVSDRAHQISEARTALEKLTVDIRQGSEVKAVGPDGLRIATVCDSSSSTVPCEVEYTCPPQGATYNCERWVGGERTIIARGLAAPLTFCVVPSAAGLAECAPTPVEGKPPTYVGVTIEFPAGKQEGKTVLQGGAALHNVTSSGEGT